MLKSLFLAMNSEAHGILVPRVPASYFSSHSDSVHPESVVSPHSYTHRGRFGVVRSCRENATGRTFLAKIVPYAAEGKHHVLQEYEVLRTLHHERLMSLHEAYITPRYLVLIAESCGNRELLCGLSDR